MTRSIAKDLWLVPGSKGLLLLAVNHLIHGLLVASEMPNRPAQPPSVRAGHRSAPAANQASTPTPKPRATRPAPDKPGDFVPVLGYDEPANFLRVGGTSPIEYSSREVNCSIQVYPFRPYRGAIGAMFHQTRLRDWIDPRYREERLAAPPVFATNRLAGADTVLTARFHDSPVGLPNERLRILVLVGDQAALIDVVANSAYTWQKAGPSVNAMLASLRVETKAAPPSVAAGPGPAGAALAGLYAGTKPKYMVDWSKPVGYGHHVLAPHYYLFSADGRVHRCYDFPPGPNGDWRRFDFDTAQRGDPVNTGRYAVRDNQLFIQMSGPAAAMIAATLRDPNLLEIETRTYEREK